MTAAAAMQRTRRVRTRESEAGKDKESEVPP
jgi:hypothetical protein